MSKTARVISLKVRARRVSDHGLNLSGVIESLNASVAAIGARVSRFDIKSELLERLGEDEVSSAGARTGRLVWDSKRINEVLMPVAAMSLANDLLAIELDQAISRRQAAYLSRYAFVEEIAGLAERLLTSRVQSLETLRELVDKHFNALNEKYNPVGLPPLGVTTPKVVVATRVAGIGNRQISETKILEGGAEKQSHKFDGSNYPTKWDPNQGTWISITDSAPVALAQETISISENEDLRHPNLENQIRRERAIADIASELLGEKIMALGVPNLRLVLKSELAAIDADIRKLQIRFIESFLIPRIDGVVTGVFAEAGVWVSTGERLLRIEDASKLYLSGTLRYTARLQVGQTCLVVSRAIFESPHSGEFSARCRVVSIRGYDAEGDKWAVTLETSDPAALALPPGYDFEPDVGFTRVTFD